MSGRGACCFLQVFFVTTASSIFAYVWLVLILTQFSEDKVELWEALLTFLFFPLLVILAYLTDKGCFRRAKPSSTTADDEGHPEKPEGNAETGFCKHDEMFRFEILEKKSNEHPMKYFADRLFRNIL